MLRCSLCRSYLMFKLF